MVFRRILCPVDFSDASREAMRVAAELARMHEAVLVLAHIWEPRLWLANAELPPEVTRRMRDQVETELAAWKVEARKLGAAEVTSKAAEGVPWDQIVQAAGDDTTIDLIVMGTHGRTALKRALLGSVAENVVRHAPCTVMVVRPRA